MCSVRVMTMHCVSPKGRIQEALSRETRQHTASVEVAKTSRFLGEHESKSGGAQPWLGPARHPGRARLCRSPVVWGACVRGLQQCSAGRRQRLLMPPCALPRWIHGRRVADWHPGCRAAATTGAGGDRGIVRELAEIPLRFHILATP
jgi:hypothetical protein